MQHCAMALLLPDTFRAHRMQACRRIPSPPSKSGSRLFDDPWVGNLRRPPLSRLHPGRSKIWSLTAESWSVSWRGHGRSWIVRECGAISRRQRLRASEKHCKVISRAKKNVTEGTHCGETQTHFYPDQGRGNETFRRLCCASAGCLEFWIWVCAGVTGTRRKNWNKNFQHLQPHRLVGVAATHMHRPTAV